MYKYKLCRQNNDDVVTWGTHVQEPHHCLSAQFVFKCYYSLMKVAVGRQNVWSVFRLAFSCIPTRWVFLATQAFIINSYVVSHVHLCNNCQCVCVSEWECVCVFVCVCQIACLDILHRSTYMLPLSVGWICLNLEHKLICASSLGHVSPQTLLHWPKHNDIFTRQCLLHLVKAHGTKCTLSLSFDNWPTILCCH